MAKLGIITWLCEFGGEISSFSIVAGLIWLLCPASSNLMCNESRRVSPYSPRQPLALFREDSINYCCQKQRHNFHSSFQIRCKYVYCGRVVLPYLHTPISKARGSASRAQRPLTMGIARRQFPSLRGTTWHNNGRNAWNGSRSEHIYATFTWRLLIFTGWNRKCHVKIVIKTDLPGFVVPVHSGLCEQYVKSLGLTPSRFAFLFRTRPCTLGQQTPAEPV